MKKRLAIAATLPALCLAGAAYAECGSLTIASMNWQSAEVLANLDKIILSEGYGCQAEIIAGDTVPSITSMTEKGQPTIVPEGWVALMPEVIAAGTAEGKIVQLGNSLSDGGQLGWFIPQYLHDAHPELNTYEDVLAHPELFPAPEDAGKGAILNGPAGWGGTVVTTQLFKALDGEGKNFVLVDTGSAAGLDGSIANAYDKQEGFVAFYWAPTSLLGKFDMFQLDAGVPHDAEEWARCTSVADCADPKLNAFPVDEVYTLAAKPFVDATDPAVVDYLNKRSWGNDIVNALMAWMTDNQATGEEGAKEFLKTHEEVWMQWVTPEAAEKIKASL